MNKRAFPFLLMYLHYAHVFLTNSRCQINICWVDDEKTITAYVKLFQSYTPITWQTGELDLCLPGPITYDLFCTINKIIWDVTTFLVSEFVFSLKL